MADMFSSMIHVPISLEASGPYVYRMVEIITGDLDRLRAQLEPLRDTWSGAAQSYQLFRDRNNWYLSAVPELMDIVANRFEVFAERGGDVS
jgi:hypothetical protein